MKNRKIHSDLVRDMRKSSTGFQLVATSSLKNNVQTLTTDALLEVVPVEE